MEIGAAAGQECIGNTAEGSGSVSWILEPGFHLHARNQSWLDAELPYDVLQRGIAHSRWYEEKDRKVHGPYDGVPGGQQSVGRSGHKTCEERQRTATHAIKPQNQVVPLISLVQVALHGANISHVAALAVSCDGYLSATGACMKQLLSASVRP